MIRYLSCDMDKQFPVKANIASVGGGVQSTVMFLMGCLGELPDLDCGIFADTGWERKKTYLNVEFLQEFGEQHGVPLYVVQYSNIREDMIDKKADGRRPAMPLFIRNGKGKPAQLRRQCTLDYKIRPIRKKVDELFKPSKKKPVAQWIGISLDEATRMRPSDVHRVYHRYPLVEKRMTRGDCYEWLAKNGFPTPVKSSCVGCPYHHDTTWAELEPEEKEDVFDFCDSIRERPLVSSMGTSKREHKNRSDPNQLLAFDVPEPAEYMGQAGILDNRQFLHRSLEPLRDEPYLRKAQSEGQMEMDLTTEVCDAGCFL